MDEIQKIKQRGYRNASKIERAIVALDKNVDTLSTLAVEAATELAALTSERDRLREAAQQANKELRRKLKDGEVVYNVLYSAQEILTAALDKDAKG